MPRILPAKSLVCSSRLERRLRSIGRRRIAGCDEAGRGALVGPLVAAAVILNPEADIPGLNDSKKIPPAHRTRLADRIRATAVAFSIVFIEAEEVDRLNVYQASRQAMLRALKLLSPRPDSVLPDFILPDFILTDAMPLPPAAGPHYALIHGDARSHTIAAASILAKVARDEHMQHLDRRYPGYQMAKNKGYGTREHREGIERLGPCPEHRRTFRPVRDIVSAGRLPISPQLLIPTDA